MGYIRRQFFFNGLFEFIIQHITFTDCNDELFMEEFGVILFQLIDQDRIFFFVVITVCGNEEQQYRVSLNMPQEPVPQSFTFSGTFDNTGKIGNTETFPVTVFHHTQVGYQGGKGVVGDLGFGSGDYREQG